MASNVYVVNSNSDTVSVYDRNVLTGELTLNSSVACGDNPNSVCVSNDGQNVYVTNGFSDTVSIYDRDASTGELILNDIIATGVSPFGICISNSGTNVYVTNYNANTISVFERNVLTGILTSVETVATDYPPRSICISNDDLNIYVATLSNVITTYSRNVSTGLLTESSTINTDYPLSICISNDGLSVYSANFNSNTVSIFSRNTSNGNLTEVGVVSASYPWGICISNDGLNVYVTNYYGNSIYFFNRNLSSGLLTFNEDIGTGINPNQICISSDSQNVYANSFYEDLVYGYNRNILTGELVSNGSAATESLPTGICVYPTTFSPATPTTLLVDVQPSGVISGDPFSTQPIIKIVDINGNLVTTATNDVDVSITVVNGSGSLSGTTTVSAVNGYATFTDLVFTGTGSFYLTFTSTGLTSVDSNEIATLTPVSLVVYNQPVVGLSGQIFTTNPVIKIVNWLNELVPDATNDVDVALVDVTGSSVLTGTLQQTASSGYASFSDLVATGYGSFYLTFSSDGLNSVNSNTLLYAPNPGNPNPPIPVKPKRSYIPLSVPTANDMEVNEFAINVADKKGYVKDSNGIIHKVFDGSQGVSSIIAGSGINIDNSTGDVTISTVASAPSLSQLTDVQITNKTDGQLLRYFAPAQKWINSNIVDGGNF